MCSLYLPMKRYSFCITLTPTAYATNDTTIIHHVYKPNFAVCVPFFHDRKLGPVFAIKLAAVFGLVFFQVIGSLYVVYSAVVYIRTKPGHRVDKAKLLVSNLSN